MANALMKKTGLYFIGNMASRCMSAMIIPIYALFVTVEALGEYDFLFTLCTLLCPVAFCAMWEAVLKFALPGNDPDTRNDALRCAVQFALVFSLLFSASLYVGSVLLGFALRNATLLMLMVMSNGMATIWQYCARAVKETKAYVASGMIGSAVNFALLLIIVCLIRGQLLGLSISYIVGQLSVVVYLEAKVKVLKRVSSGRYRKDLIAKMLRYCVPCVFNLLSMSLLMGVGRILIMSAYGADANGQYAFAMKFASVITAIGSIFSMAVIEEGILRERCGSLASFYSKLMNCLVMILAALGAISIPVIGLFYLLVSETAYYESFVLIPLVVTYAIAVVLSTNFGSSFMAQGKTEMNMWSTMGGLLACVASSLILMSRFGLFGVTTGLLIGAAAMMLLRAFFSMKMIGYRVNAGRTILLLALYVLVAIQCVWLFDNGFNLWVVIAVSVLGIAMVPVAIKGMRGLMSIKDIASEGV